MCELSERLYNSGISQGIAQGEAKEKTTIAKTMLAKGSFPLELISEMTKLSLADVQKLQTEMTAN